MEAAVTVSCLAYDQLPTLATLKALVRVSIISVAIPICRHMGIDSFHIAELGVEGVAGWEAEAVETSAKETELRATVPSAMWPSMCSTADSRARAHGQCTMQTTLLHTQGPAATYTL